MVYSLFHHRSPAIWLSLVCVVLVILLWPPMLEKVISLNWKICDMHPIVLGTQSLMAVMAIIILLKLTDFFG